MSAVSESLVKWVRHCLKVDEVTEDGAVNRLELWHAVDGDNPERCETFYMGDDVSDVDDLSQTIWDVAEHDSATRTMGMKQRYVVLAYRGDSAESDSRHPFTITSGTSFGTTFGGDTEAPNEKGALAHFMRHDTNMHGMMMQLTEITAGRLMKENATLSRRLERAEEVAMTMFETHQQLLDKKAERDIEMAKELQKSRRHEEFMSMLMSMGPLLLAKFMGGGAGSNIRDVGVGKILESLTFDEFQGIMKSLAPAKQLMMMELYKSYAEDRQKQLSGLPDLLKPDPEATH